MVEVEVEVEEDEETGRSLASSLDGCLVLDSNFSMTPSRAHRHWVRMLIEGILFGRD